MVSRDVEFALQDCDSFLELVEQARDMDLPNRVIASLYIRAVIRGNDALCLHFLGERPSRHGQAPRFFQRLYEDDHISDEHSKYRNNLGELVDQKADMEYKPVSLSKGDLDTLEKRATRFIENAVYGIL